jgi:hypothetical protein
VKRFRGLPVRGWAVLFIIPFVVGLAFAGSLKGKVKSHVYYSPANNFTVPVPSGTFQKWSRVEDNFSSDGGPGGVRLALFLFRTMQDSC